MAYIIAVLMAALSFLLNRAALRYVGINAVITCSPAMEEAAKTLLAYYLGADIFLTHAFFGVIEGGYDGLNGGKRGAVAALLSVAGHSLFGLVTVAVIYLAGSVALALAAAVAVHLAWNVTLIRLTA